MKRAIPNFGDATQCYSEQAAAVGIVGAGPVGLSCALCLAKFGVKSVLFERNHELKRQGSKACLIQGDVLEVLDKFDCGEAVAAKGVPWRIGHTYIRGEEIATQIYPEREGFAEFVNLSQFRIEEILLARLVSEPLCEIRWRHEAVSVQETDGKVLLTLDGPDGPGQQAFRYLVACDGSRSRIRECLGLEWTGYTHADQFLITDIRARLPQTKERHFHFDPSFNPGRQVIMQPQPDEVWRIDWQLSPDADIEAERLNGKFDRRIRDVIGNVDYQIEWLSTYRFNQRVAERLSGGSVFLAGDAAHAFPPYGSRGMNSGIQDVDNLSWKLAWVLSGRAPETMLESYHAERHAAARENLRITEDTIRFMVPPNRVRRAARNLLLYLSRQLPLLRKFVNSGRMASPFVYPASELVDHMGRHPLCGAYLPDLLVVSETGSTRLRRFFGTKFIVLFVLPTERDIEKMSARLADCPAFDPEPIFVVTSDGDCPYLSRTQTVLKATPALMSERFGAVEGCWFLVRPDLHIGACGAIETATAKAISDAYARCSGRWTAHAVPNPNYEPVREAGL